MNNLEIFGGVDVGTQSVKLALLGGDEVMATRTIPIQEEEIDVQGAMKNLLREMGHSWEEIALTVATGVGRNTVPFAGKVRSEQLCHARGAHWLFPGARTVLDVGAEGCRAMKLNERGDVQDFSCNSKCAAGTGAFVEVMATLLEVPLAEVGEWANRTTRREKVSSYCTVFAESEVISLIHQGRSREAILAGVVQAVAERSFELLKKVGLRSQIILTGGTAKNQRLRQALEEMADQEVLGPPDPQVIGALGAALFARSFSMRSEK